MSLNDNRVIAERLQEAAALLEQQNANRYRVAAYRRAANSLKSCPRSASVILSSGGLEGLMAETGIGPQIAGAVVEMIRTGRWTQLERLRGTLDPEALFSSVPGVGPKLAKMLMDALHVDSLEALEVAAHDGRLAKVPQFGARRIAMIRAELAQMLGRSRPVRQSAADEPGVDVLLDVDREYRDKAAAGELPRIAPKRFNPSNEAWLPILHAERGDWHFSVLFSNTDLAHRLGRINDWVVIYFRLDSNPEGQRTVVTEIRGNLKGRRVVRGREHECDAYYRQPVQLPLGAA